MGDSKIDYATKLIKNEYFKNDDLWILGFSGGKDSSAILKLILEFLSENNTRALKRIIVSYCDTGIEIPLIRDFALNTLTKIENYARVNSLPIQTKIVSPAISNSFFVKIIGRGYPPPTNKFRWCTRRLRETPIQSQIDSVNNHRATVLLGTRKNESVERNKIIDRYIDEDQIHFKQNGKNHISIFCPIINFSQGEIWEFLLNDNKQSLINYKDLENIYRMASDDSYQSYPTSRFGCWCCTVIRKDHAVNNLINNGISYMIPLYDFRNWLMEIRELPIFRSNYRRNGVKGLGPFKLHAREMILSRLLDIQKESQLKLITTDELSLIRKLWDEDITSTSYKE